MPTARPRPTFLSVRTGPTPETTPEPDNIGRQGLGNASGATAQAIVSDFDSSGLANDTTRGIGRRHTANEGPVAGTAGWKIGHVLASVLDEMLDAFRTDNSAKPL